MQRVNLAPVAVSLLGVMAPLAVGFASLAAERTAKWYALQICIIDMKRGLHSMLFCYPTLWLSALQLLPLLPVLFFLLLFSLIASFLLSAPHCSSLSDADLRYQKLFVMYSLGGYIKLSTRSFGSSYLVAANRLQESPVAHALLGTCSSSSV